MSDPNAFLNRILADADLQPPRPAVFEADLFNRLRQSHDEHRAKYKPLAEFKVTQAQLDELATMIQPITSAPFPPMPLIFGIPVRLVDTFEESTVYEQWLDKVKAECAAPPETYAIEFPTIYHQGF